jgi:hypothetical protein
MTVRRSTIGLMLLCGLAFFAVAAPSAMAKGTTAFTCEPVSVGAEFEDEHCDKAKAGGSGFKHTAIAAGVATEVSFTNEKTQNLTTEAFKVFLPGKFEGVAVEIVCEEVTSGAGAATTLENKEVEGKMLAEGPAELKFGKCKVNKPEKCTVKEPIVTKVKAKTKVIKETAPEEMGVEFTASGANLGEIEFKNKEAEVCPLNGKKAVVTGTFTATPEGIVNGKGATWAITAAMSNLKFGTEVGKLETIVTARMAGIGGNPIVLTTTAN